MPRVFSVPGTIALFGLLISSLYGCNGVKRDQEPAAGAPKPAVATTSADKPEQQAEPATETAQADEDAEAKAKKEAEEKEKKEKQEAKKAKERERKLPKLDRDLGVAKMKLDKAKLVFSYAQIKFQQTLAKAEAELDLAEQKLATFKEVTIPNRIARAELSLQATVDGLRETREELEQLELMYNEEQFADQTKEIVIERARRRLERVERNFELRQQEHQTLVEITIPRETLEKDLGVQQKHRALGQLKRDDETAAIDRHIGVINAEAEIIRLEHELTDLKEEIEEAEQKKAEEQAEEAKQP